MDAKAKVIVSAQVDLSLRARLAELAAKADRSLSAEIRRTLVEHVQAADLEDDE